MSEADKPGKQTGRSSIAAKDDVEVIDEYVERARQHHAEHGVWPPDPLLDEVDDMRRAIMAEHGNDWRKVLGYYVELGKQNPNRVVHAPRPLGEEPSAA